MAVIELDSEQPRRNTLNAWQRFCSAIQAY